MTDFFVALPDYNVSLFENKKSKWTCDIAKVFLVETVDILSSCSDFNNNTLYNILCEYAVSHNLKTSTVMWAIRVAVSGKMSTPAGATGIMEVLGKEKSIERIQKAIEILGI